MISRFVSACARPRAAATFALCLVIPSVAVLASADSNVADIGSRRELFVDDALIERISGGAALRLREPIAREISIVHEREWEGASCNYYTVFRDTDRYRMYYRGSGVAFPDGKLDEKPHPLVYCYAESEDGIRWRKPELGLREFNGSTRNNIVVSPGPYPGFELKMADSASFFRDDNPKATPDAAYKAFVRIYDKDAKINGIVPFKSPDGVTWTPMAPGPTIKDGAFDSQNLAFWDTEREEYRAYWRISVNAPGTPRGKVRAIRTAVSSDFIHWDRRAEVTYIDSPPEELYTSQIRPYHRAPHLYLGFPARYVERPQGPSMRALPDPEHREMRGKALPRTATAVSESLLMASRDGVRFKRWNESFLRPGPERGGTWNYGHQFMAWHPVETKSALEGAPNELSLYACEGLWVTQAARVRRFTLRLDGFVSLSAQAKGGELVTKPIRFKGSALNLNFATSAVGVVRVELQDAEGRALPGFSADDCDPLFGDTVDRQVTWKGSADVGSLAGRAVRLKFFLSDADLYAYRFGE